MNGFVDRALLIAILAAVGGLYWKMFDVGERLARIEVRVETIDVTALVNSLVRGQSGPDASSAPEAPWFEGLIDDEGQ